MIVTYLVHSGKGIHTYRRQAHGTGSHGQFIDPSWGVHLWRPFSSIIRLNPLRSFNLT